MEIAAEVGVTRQRVAAIRRQLGPPTPAVEPRLCPQCGVVFLPQANRNRYCSQACGSLAQRRRVNTFCYTCGLPVEIPRAQFHRYPNHFCGRPCRSKMARKLGMERRIEREFVDSFARVP